MKLIVATWATAAKYLGEAWQCGSSEDAVEQVIRAVEDDPEERSVGYNGSLTSEGHAELDAAFMEGKDRRIGAVAVLEGFRHPVSAARAVMERSPHNLLVGPGAIRFAKAQGMERCDMASPQALEEYERFRAQGHRPDGHDTIGAIAWMNGHFACAMSTSGLRFRAPGRVSDSALPGCGFVCDDRIGAAVSTGVGEDIMRSLLAAKVFFYMEEGMAAPEAALRAVREAHARLRDAGRFSVLAVDRAGKWGAASNHDLFCASVSDGERPPRVERIPYCYGNEEARIPMARGE